MYDFASLPPFFVPVQSQDGPWTGAGRAEAVEAQQRDQKRSDLTCILKDCREHGEVAQGSLSVMRE